MAHILLSAALGARLNAENRRRDVVGLSQHGGRQRKEAIRPTGCVPVWDPGGGESEEGHRGAQEEKLENNNRGKF
ncbi:unnamed protein product [Tetraodon nigroviridis]|uniref:(spotted green pufferfish) hypothetical protein n=1 Tax=Tetraodon nigroviridis TaxID=99883 RepID=Q4RQY1_TETNG|nr:unnamed protein product [Tetraodon nigroviridis]